MPASSVSALGGGECGRRRARSSHGKIIAGARKTADSMEFADSARLMKSMGPTGFTRENTTLVVVATNAALTKVEATKLAQLGQLGMTRVIYPVNTMSDGDLVVAMSCGTARAPIDALGVAAAEAVSEAILRAVRMAPSLGRRARVEEIRQARFA